MTGTGDTVVSICSGVGGLDKGLTDVTGGRVVVHVEIDEAAQAVLRAHHPDVPILDDVRDPDAFLPFVGATWVTAGYPCQPFSEAGRRLGNADPRHLWPYVRDVIRIVGPEFVLLENVRGHVKRGLPEVLADLAALGYTGVWTVVRASDVGAPHQRARVFVLAHRSTVDYPERSASSSNVDRREAFAEVTAVSEKPAKLLKTPTAQLAVNGGSQHPDKRKSGGHGPTLADEVEHLLPTPAAVRYGSNRGGAAGRVGPLHHGLDAIDKLLPTPVARDHKGTDSPSRQGGAGLPSAALLLPTPRATDGTNGGPADRGRRGDLMMPSAVHVQDWAQFGSAVGRWEHVTGRTAPPPKESGSRGGEVLAVAFVEWMMGYPTTWVTGVAEIARNARLRCLGNAVVPLQASYAVGILMRALRDRLKAIDAPLVRQVPSQRRAPRARVGSDA